MLSVLFAIGAALVVGGNMALLWKNHSVQHKAEALVSAFTEQLQCFLEERESGPVPGAPSVAKQELQFLRQMTRESELAANAYPDNPASKTLQGKLLLLQFERELPVLLEQQQLLEADALVQQSRERRGRSFAEASTTRGC